MEIRLLNLAEVASTHLALKMLSTTISPQVGKTAVLHCTDRINRGREVAGIYTGNNNKTKDPRSNNFHLKVQLEVPPGLNLSKVPIAKCNRRVPSMDPLRHSTLLNRLSSNFSQTIAVPLPHNHIQHQLG
jgi:hypothetical protein